MSSPPGTVIGSIKQEWTILKPKFTVRNASDDVVLRIEGPFCTYSICGDVEFQVREENGLQLLRRSLNFLSLRNPGV